MLHLRAGPRGICDRRVPMTSLLIFKQAESLLVKLRTWTHLRLLVHVWDSRVSLSVSVKISVCVEVWQYVKIWIHIDFLLLEIISGCLDVLGLPFFCSKNNPCWLNEYCQSWWVSGYSDSPVVKNNCNVLRDEPKSPVYITCFSLSEAHCTGLILLWGRS